MKDELNQFLRENVDVFAWKHNDMVGLDLYVAYHVLKVDLKIYPSIQKRRLLSTERYGTLKEKVDKLLANRFIKEAVYLQWVSNSVLLKENAGAIYQRLVNCMFLEQIRNTMDVNVDDKLVKSVNAEDHIEAQLSKMKFRPLKMQEIFGLHGKSTRDRGQSREDQNACRYEISILSQGGPKPHKKIGSLKLIYIKGNRPLPVLLPDHQRRKVI
ncbi:Ribonuclease H [Abeliophyllum distichum]|uniref:Ribonuclease H n=1 Tax=Abeliophyllum distichum TaxID=126358 RepID=A0ABD1TJI5_9LAMI